MARSLGFVPTLSSRTVVPALDTIFRSRNRIAILTINISSASLGTLQRYTYKQIAQHSTTPL
jgi:hypothetical protein